VVAVVFQSVFRAEMHQHDIYFIFKKLFLRSAHQNDLKHIIFFKKKHDLHRVFKRRINHEFFKLTYEFNYLI
jgi:hypothetical protein